MATKAEDYKRVLVGFADTTNEYGPKWWEKIDLDTLYMGSLGDCVLGQLGNYHETMHKMQGTSAETCHDVDTCHQWAIAHGFDVERGLTAEYEALTEVWRELITTAKASRD